MEPTEPRTELRGSSVLLRPLTDDDVVPHWEAVVESKAELIPWMQWCHEEYSRDESASWVAITRETWDRREMFNFLVVDPADGRVLGSCALNQVDWANRRANLGYWVRTSACGQGAATEASRVLALHGLEGMGLVRVEIIAAVGNRASQRVAEKLGATREGVLRNRTWVGGPQDCVCYSLTPDDLPRLRR